MEEQISPAPDRSPDSAHSMPAESAPSPAIPLPAAPLHAAQPTGGDPFHAVAPPPVPPPVPPPAPPSVPPSVPPAPPIASAPPITPPPQFTPAPAPIVEPLSPPPPRVVEVEATGLSASDVRRPVVDAAPVSPQPPRPEFTIPEPKPAESQAAAAPPPSPSSPPPPAPPPPVAPRAPKPPSRFKRNAWAIVCHLLLVLVIPTVFLGATLTFLIWQIKGKSSSHVEDQGREALNFQINVAALTAILTVSCLGAPLIVLVWFVAIVMAIIAARHALHGENYRYPWVFRIVSH